MWWNRDAFHCGSGPRGVVHFHDIILKVQSQPFPMRMSGVCCWVRVPCLVDSAVRCDRERDDPDLGGGIKGARPRQTLSLSR